MASSGLMHPQPSGPLPEDGVAGDQGLVLVDVVGEGLGHLGDQGVELVGHVGEQPPHPDERGVHPHPAHQLVDVQDLLPLPPGVDEGGGGAEVEGAGPVPDQVAGDPGQLAHDHPQVLRPRRDLDAQQPLRRQGEAEVVAERREVVHPVRVGDALLVVVPLEVLLEAGVQEADVRPAAAHDLAVQVQHQAEHAVGGGVLGPHVQLHGLVVELDQVDGVELGSDPEQLPAVLVLLGDGVAAGGAERRQHAHRRITPSWAEMSVIADPPR